MFSSLLCILTRRVQRNISWLSKWFTDERWISYSCFGLWKRFTSATTITLFTTGAYNDTTPEYVDTFDTVGYGNSTGFIFRLWWQSLVELVLSGTITVGPYSDYRNFEFDYDVASAKLEINSRTDATEAKTVMVHEVFQSGSRCNSWFR